jgi:O-antigen ligase
LPSTGSARLAAWLAVPAVAALAVAAGILASPHIGTGTKIFPMAAVGLAGCVALGVAILVVDPAWILSIGLALSIFSGDWSYIHIPVPLDRLVLFVGLAAVLVRPLFVADAPRIQIRRIHWVLGAIALYGFGSAAWSGTLTEHTPLFALLDRLGIVPFLLYLVAPAAFPTERQRRTLLVTLVVVGAYLGVTAFFEMIGPHSLVFPSYINDPAVGIHDGRARGPFLEAGADGLAMFAGAVACVMIWPTVRRRARAVLVAIIFLCLLGIVLTLTRQVWVGAAVGAVLAMLVSHRLRRWVPVVCAAVALIVGGALIAVPGLQAKLHGRATTQRSIWDRLNSDEAALRMAESRPLLGYGWGEFTNESSRFYHVAHSYPLTSVAEVHNVILSNAAELGLLVTVVWLGTLLVVMVAPLRRRGPPELEPWKVGLVAIAVSWFVQANFAPVSYAFDNYLPWLFAAIALGPPAAAAAIERPIRGMRFRATDHRRVRTVVNGSLRPRRGTSGATG